MRMTRPWLLPTSAPATRARPRAVSSETPTVVSKPGSGAPVLRAWRMPRSSAMSRAFTRLTGSTFIAESRPSTAAINTGRGAAPPLPLLELARRLGRLARPLADGPVTAVTRECGGTEDAAARTALASAVNALLSAMNVEPVSLVNALLIAEERGIRHARKTGAPEPGFETTVGVSLETARGRARVAGALVGNSHGRVIRIDDYHVDVAPEGWILVIRNRDVPGVIGRVGTLLGGAGINIGAYHQARLDLAGHDALAAIAVDQALMNGVLDALAKVPEIQQVRLAYLGA